jgi:hypothetical protein
MKKTLLVLALIAFVASASFADVSFMTANSVGAGKFAVLGMYAQNNQTDVSGTLIKNSPINIPGLGIFADNDSSGLSATSLGLKVEYGLPQVENLDVVGGYTSDTLPLVNKKWGSNSTGGNTTALGLKYTLPSMGLPVDSAVVVGYEYSALKIGGVGYGTTTYAVAGIVSKQMGMFVPYGGISLKSVSQNAMAGNVDARPGTGVQLNLGCAIGVAANQAVMVEINSEVDNWKDTKAKDDAYSSWVGGLSLGYVYMF